MTKIHLTLSCGDYDRTRPLIDGTVSTPELALTVIPLPSAERHTRFVRGLEFDVCELQIAQYLGLKSRGVPITAIPVFPHRRFNHSCVMVRMDSDIARPEGYFSTPEVQTAKSAANDSDGERGPCPVGMGVNLHAASGRTEPMAR